MRNPYIYDISRLRVKIRTGHIPITGKKSLLEPNYSHFGGVNKMYPNCHVFWQGEEEISLIRGRQRHLPCLIIYFPL